ncbi:MAG: 4-alpha-glucanotransferase [Desulfobaccales bacterium]|nr:4-alpha-glucanotransferase [Desulfobaccales bacterium]
MDHKAKIVALGRLCGIAAEYRDNFGCRRRTSLATTKELLTAMGVPWQEPARLDQELNRRRLQPFDRLLSPVQVITGASASRRVAVYPWTPTPALPARLEVKGEIVSDTGQRSSWETAVKAPASPISRAQEDGFRTRLDLPLPPGLELGYYELSLRVNRGAREEEGKTRLILAPAQAYLPEALAAGGRVWGLSLPLYALRSKDNWGLGDFADLKEVTTWAASLGAAFVGVNPLHAPAPQAEADPSPYSPTSRLFLNFLYLRLETVPELPACPEAQAFLAGHKFQALKTRLQTARLVDYPEVYRLKQQILKWLYQTFRDRHGPPEAPRTLRGRQFARFLAERGEPLTKFGQYCALTDFFEQSDWRRWPSPYHHPESSAVAAFTREHLEEIRVHQYGQWLAASQLTQVGDQALRQGLPFTLYQDLALGAACGGFDTWAQPELFALNAAMGAPPDAFNPKGQNWGLPPLIPERLRESGYQWFTDTLRANSPERGLLRLDHVMSLFRLFWIPAGQPAGKGAYVRYPARELLAILALESLRRRTLIIGEDLGTVAPGIRRDLSKTGVFSYRVFYFERDRENRFLPPQDYPAKAVAAVTTHDLPTLAGFWQGRDVELKRTLNLYPEPEQADTDALARTKDRLALVEALRSRGLLPADFRPKPHPGESCPQELRFGVLEYLAQSEATLLEVRLEEVFGLTEQQNLPGTRKEHPNWRLKLPLTLKQMRQAPQPAQLAARLNRYRGRGG